MALPLLASSPSAWSQPVSVARVAYVEGFAERSGLESDWGVLEEGTVVQIGDRYRTGPGSRARIDFRWMSVAIDGESQLSIPNAFLLSAELDHGRVEPYSPSGAMLKMVTAEASVRGSGRVVVRRRDGVTLVSVREGEFTVQRGVEEPVEVRAGHGLIVRAAGDLEVVALAPPPEGLEPGRDPGYVRRGEPVALSWKGEPGMAYHIELLGHTGEEVVLGRDVSGTGFPLAIPWEGTFQWRVAAIGDEGLEGMPSAPGVVCIVDQ
jgi:hypothetical protein